LTFIFNSNNTEETFALGQRIGSILTGGSVVALCGELGSGKTCLTKGIALGLGIKETITSPTYTIISEYETESKERCVFYHIDAYRLKNNEDFENIGGAEILSSNGICVIEWSERVLNLLPIETVKINIKITNGNSRIIQVEGLDSL
jgi:tRNA threonylcarbamoyladenosine biosynthesis protein TsaE